MSSISDSSSLDSGGFKISAPCFFKSIRSVWLLQLTASWYAVKPAYVSVSILNFGNFSTTLASVWFSFSIAKWSGVNPDFPSFN